MDFERALKYLESFVSYENMISFDYSDFDLENFREFVGGIGLGGVRFVHVAGSKGKGSVCGMVDEYLREIGNGVGLYTSPHLLDVRERICVDGKMISREKFAEYVEKLGARAEKFGVTYFEFLTAIALMYFAESGVQYAVLEVGLGGRLDATNVVVPDVSVLTRVELEHTDVLGSDLGGILDEKLGIMKSGVPFLIGEQSDEVMDLLKKKDFDMVFSENLEFLNGDRAKVENGCTAYSALKILLGNVEKSVFKRVFDEFHLAGRFDVRVVEGKTVVFDIAHTVNSIQNLIETLQQRFKDKKFVFLVSLMKGKDVESILNMISEVADRVILTSSHKKRGFTGAELAKFTDGEVCEDAEKAFRQCFTGDTFDEVVVVTGSHFISALLLSSLLP